MNLVTNTGAELFKSVYGAACASLLNHMELILPTNGRHLAKRLYVPQMLLG